MALGLCKGRHGKRSPRRSSFSKIGDALPLICFTHWIMLIGISSISTIETERLSKIIGNTVHTSIISSHWPNLKLEEVWQRVKTGHTDLAGDLPTFFI